MKRGPTQDNPIIVNGHVPSVVRYIDLEGSFDNVVGQLDAARHLILDMLFLKRKFDSVKRIRILIQTVEVEGEMQK